MKRLLIRAALLAFATGAFAQNSPVIVRRAQVAQPVELRGGNLSFVLPEGGFVQSLNGAWVSRRAGQDATLQYQPAPEIGLIVRYTMRGQVEEGFSYGNSSAWARFFTMGQRPALVVQFTETTSLEAALESQARFDATMQAETSQRREAVLRSVAVSGLTFSASVGQMEIRNAAGQVRDQTFVTISAEQKLPGMPVRLTLAPSFAQESWRGFDSAPTPLAGGNAALALDATERTTLSLLVSRLEGTPAPEAAKNAFAAWAVQIEQRLSPSAVVRLRAGYEEQSNATAVTSGAVFLGAESTFSLTDSLNGGVQLRQRAVQLINAAAAIPDTVLSFSLGGAF